MLSVRDVEGAERGALEKLAKAGRALLDDTAQAVVTIDGRSYYHLSTLRLLDFAKATREAEGRVKDDGG